MMCFKPEAVTYAQAVELRDAFAEGRETAVYFDHRKAMPMDKPAKGLNGCNLGCEMKLDGKTLDWDYWGKNEGCSCPIVPAIDTITIDDETLFIRGLMIGGKRDCLGLPILDMPKIVPKTARQTSLEMWA